MRKVFIIISILFSAAAQAQYTPVPGSFSWDGGIFRRGFVPPRRDTVDIPGKIDTLGTVVMWPAKSSLWLKVAMTGRKWVEVTAGGQIPSVKNIADLRQFSPIGKDSLVNLRGYYSPNDGGGGAFYWSDKSVMSDNGGSVIKVGTITTGRWKRIITGDVDFRMFGARGDSVNDDSEPVQRAIDAFQQPGVTNSGAHFTFSKGHYLLANVIIKSGTYIDAYQAARDNYIPNVPVTISAYGNPEYIFDIDPAATNWSIRNLSIDGDYLHQPQLK